MPHSKPDDRTESQAAFSAPARQTAVAGRPSLDDDPLRVPSPRNEPGSSPTGRLLPRRRISAKNTAYLGSVWVMFGGLSWFIANGTPPVAVAVTLAGAFFIVAAGVIFLYQRFLS